MNNIEIYLGEDKIKMDSRKEEKQAKRKEHFKAVDELIRKRMAAGENHEKILGEYFEKYKSYLDSPHAERMNTKTRLEFLKEQIYEHEPDFKEEREQEYQKAA